MTTPYGVTKQGIREQFVADGHTDDLEGSISVNACYLRDVVYDAIGSVVVAAREYMDWLRTVATIASVNNHKLCWTTPAGFRVRQAYLKDRSFQVTTTLQRIYLKVPINDWLINSRRQMNGLPPNYIHSLDAAHMMLTVAAAKKEDIHSFQMIHDSYATHAGHMERFNQILREQFVSMHEQLPLWKFKKEIEESCKIELPPPPPQGSFDLKNVLTSRHFFS
jgi:DNA-directed RNA polymerase